jgi:hypothetical protein
MIVLNNIKENNGIVSADISQYGMYDAHIVIDYINQKIISCDSNSVPESDIKWCINKCYKEMSLWHKLPKKLSIEWY